MLKKIGTKAAWCIALALGVLALGAGAAVADVTPPATGTTGASGATGPAGAHQFSCDAAEARLARVEGRIAAIEARIASGHVKDPAKAAARLAAAQDTAAKISGRIAKRC